MSLADELLADFEEAGDDVGETEGEGQMLELAEVDDVTMETHVVTKNSVRNIAKLRDSEEVWMSLYVLSMLPVYIADIQSHRNRHGQTLRPSMSVVIGD